MTSREERAGKAGAPSCSSAAPTLCVMLPMVRRVAVAVIFQVEIVIQRPLSIEVVARKDLGGNRQLFPLNTYCSPLLESCFLKGM
jgi:hypothetical protein